MPKPLLIVILFLTTISADAESATYKFCINVEGFESFRAEVNFRAVDFGENTARQMVMNEIRSAFGETVKVSITGQAVCPCDNNCQILKVTPRKWDGNMGRNFEKAGVKTLPSSSAAVIDHLMFEVQSLFSDPGGFLRRNFFEK